MLQLIDISKSYTTGSFTQKALDGVSLSFRDSEFVAVLGPSGSGKTTMLNIVGGLDHYDSGDLVVDGVSTKEYKDRDWDAYRNNRIGFVFQSYNLIPHQTVLANVELALTLSGVSHDERRRRALDALARVGLADHVGKKPSQLSGGQMQRVAIARALINDPEILLADEPTGALDSKTSVQIMDLLTEIAADRLVIMVTHNPELAERYATRIVNLADGVISSDSNPYLPTAEEVSAAHAKPARRTAMSFFTALSLSFNNLMTKKGRTLMTAIAGSIGIIGIAAILALANGVNNYIKNVEEETLSVYPLSIQSTGIDLASFLVGSSGDSAGSSDTSSGPTLVSAGNAAGDESSAEGAGTVNERKTLTNMFSRVGKNDLASLKKFLDANGGGIDEYVNLIQYNYGIVPQIYASDTSKGVRQVNPDTSFAALGAGSNVSSNSLVSMSMSTDVFSMLPSDTSLVENQYDLKAGTWPEKLDELVLVLNRDGSISDLVLYDMGLRDPDELDAMVEAFANEENVDTPENSLSFTNEQLMASTFKLVNAFERYRYDSDYHVWIDKSEDESFMTELVDNGLDLHVVGIVQAKEDANATALTPGLYYTPELQQHLIDQASVSDIVEQQLADPETDVLTGKSFEEEASEPSGEFDLSLLFTIDREALSAAFTIDTSALGNLNLSGLDFSNMNLASAGTPSFDLSNVDLSGVDLTGIDLSNVDLSGLASEFPELADALQNLDYAAVLQAAATALVENGDQSIGQAFSEIMQGYPAYLAANPGATVSDYLGTPAVRERVNSVIAQTANNEHLQSAIRAELERQLSERLGGADLGQVTAAVQQRIVAAVTSQLAEQLAGSLSDALTSSLQASLSAYLTQMMTALQSQIGSALQSSFSSLSSNLSGAFGIDEQAFASAFQFNMDQKELAELMASMMSTRRASYEGNLKALGYAEAANPSSIDIYPVDFNGKERVIAILDAYNEDARAAGDEDRAITYTDLVGTLMSSVTDIIDMISYVLIAFVSISLVVSSIMIGVITYISVLERKKEIGILRSIGARKRDISNVFNAETVIEGLIAGVLGVGVTALACIPVNAVVYELFDVPTVALLPWQAAVALVAISVLLTFLAGLIPASSASRKDPVEALRSE